MAALALDIVIRGVAARELALDPAADDGLELHDDEQRLLDEDEGEPEPTAEPTPSAG